MKCLLLTKEIILQSGEVNKNKVNLGAGAATQPVSDIADIVIVLIVIVAIYVFFEIIIINYRPIILSQSLEASFPSSHTMIVICIMSTAMLQFHYYLRDKKVCLWTIDIACVLMLAVTVIGRLISGVHWFTDIVAGILLSSALVALYYSTLKYIKEKKG